MSRRAPVDGLRELMQKLWSERQLLELLLFRLVTAKLILASDLRRYVPPARAEIEQVVERIRGAELARAVAVAGLAEAWGVHPDVVSLEFLAERSPEPYASMFAEHRETFLKLTADIENVSRENRRMASVALDHIRENTQALMGGDPATTYSPTGRRAGLPAAPNRLDRNL